MGYSVGRDSDPEVSAARAVEMCSLILSLDCIALARDDCHKGDVRAGCASCSPIYKPRVPTCSRLQVTSMGTQTTTASDCFVETAFLPTLLANLWKYPGCRHQGQLGAHGTPHEAIPNSRVLQQCFDFT